MNPEQEPAALPPELEEALRALGDVAAPPELADRVQLARLGGSKAPAELQDRVEMALFGQAQAPAELEERVTAEVRKLTRPILPGFFTWRRAAAAAVLVAVGSLVNLSGEQPDPFDEYKSARGAVGQEFLMLEVPAEELSDAAKLMAHGFGAPLRTEGAE